MHTVTCDQSSRTGAGGTGTTSVPGADRTPGTGAVVAGTAVASAGEEGGPLDTQVRVAASRASAKPVGCPVPASGPVVARRDVG